MKKTRHINILFRHWQPLSWVAFAALGACIGCSSSAETKLPADTLVKIGKAVLTRTDLDRNTPGGLDAADSTKFAQAYIRTWIDDQLVKQVAAKQIDLTEINKLTDQYRSQLIMEEYTTQMFQTYGPEPASEDSLQSYYQSHQEEFRLSRPLVKGLYIKVEDDARTLPSLRKLYRSQKQEDIDKLEKTELTDALHYDYFRDKWIDWEQIESRIPYDFGTSSDAFLKAHDNLDFSYGGFTYLLDITDFLPTGSIAPFEVARKQILDRMNFYERRNFKDQLKRNIYDDAISNGSVTLFCELPNN